MNLYELFKDLWINQRLLMMTGLAGFILSIVLIIFSLFDSQQILGINRWIKPVKFTVSGAVFLWTVAIYLYYLQKLKSAVRIIAGGTTFAMVGEVVLIVIQAARGTTSHFNFSTALDSAIFGLMGLLILLNTVLIFYLAYLYVQAEINLPKALVWGMRLGLIVFLIGSIQGGYMSGQTGHTVSLPDGAAGLPFLSWSTEGGDLRVAHFVGLHAFQAIPLFAMMLVWVEKRFTTIRATALTIVFSIIYLGMFLIVFIQALRGKPLLGKEITVAERLVIGAESKR